MDQSLLEAAMPSYVTPESPVFVSAPLVRTMQLVALCLAPVLACVCFGRGVLRGLATAWSMYEAASLTHPLLTKSITSGLAYVLGDLAAQRLAPETARKRLDRGRLTRATVAGAVSHGPQLQ